MNLSSRNHNKRNVILNSEINVWELRLEISPIPSKEGEIEIDKFQNKGFRNSQKLKNQSEFQKCKDQLSEFGMCSQEKLGFYNLLCIK